MNIDLNPYPDLVGQFHDCFLVWKERWERNEITSRHYMLELLSMQSSIHHELRRIARTTDVEKYYGN